ncbi:hypothetical protein [Staphylococcus nepalensis]|uniref:hypothetical protein n=1 Tax=Staphylococcus nepalensis TaxID=214473 RepID=UPI0030171AA3
MEYNIISRIEALLWVSGCPQGTCDEIMSELKCLDDKAKVTDEINKLLDEHDEYMTGRFWLETKEVMKTLKNKEDE